MTFEDGCSWPIFYSNCSPAVSGVPDVYPEGVTADDVEIYEQMAVDMLSQWTGEQFGTCEVTIRPQRVSCETPSTFWGQYFGIGFTPLLLRGKWYNITCGSCVNVCSCESVSVIKIPGPVQSIEEIMIDGEVLDENAYRVDNWNLLVRQDGGEWPSTQDLSLELDQVGTWGISYTRGRPVPKQGQLAAGLLAVEFAKAACGSKSCVLPKRVSTISRDGISMQLLDEFQDLEAGRTGVYVADSWVASVMKAPKRSTVISPDYGTKTRVTTWSADMSEINYYYGGTY